MVRSRAWQTVFDTFFVSGTDIHAGEVYFEELGYFRPLYGCIIPQVTDPLSPDELDITFKLFANSSADCEELKFKSSDEQVAASSFDGTKETKILIHGFRDKYSESHWMGVSF